MEKINFIRKVFLLLFGLNIYMAQAQKPAFKSFSDSSFQKGDRIIIHDLLDNDKRLEANSKNALMRMAAFAQKHPDLELEIGVHSSVKGNELYNKKMTIARAQEIVDSLNKGYRIPLKQLVPYGYGKSAPLHTEEEIKKIKDPARQKEMHMENYRVELKILGKLE